MKNRMFIALLMSVLVVLPSLSCWAEKPDALYDQVQTLNLSRQGYVLGARLTPAQEALSRKQAVESAFPGTIKFMDHDLAIVVDSRNHRILVIYEHHETVSRQQLKDLIGELFLSHDEPTVTAHDTVIYWAFGSKGKFSTQEFDAAKSNRKPLPILATVKLSSDSPIMEAKADTPPASAYVIISSDSLLKAFQTQ